MKFNGNSALGRRVVHLASMLVLGYAAAGCHPQQSTDPVNPSANIALQDDGAAYPAGVSGLNYSKYGIASFSITDADGRTGGGPNISPSKGDGKPAGGGAEMCCVIVPAKWHEGMTVTVQWSVEKLADLVPSRREGAAV
jgi:hypothetical protein